MDVDWNSMHLAVFNGGQRTLQWRTRRIQVLQLSAYQITQCQALLQLLLILREGSEALDGRTSFWYSHYIQIA